MQQPTAYDPLRNPELSTTRRNVVLRRMAELGFVSQDEADRAALVPMERMLRPSTTTNGCTSTVRFWICGWTRLFSSCW